MESRTIQAIDKGDVHRICSGQVVLSLATAVKELVENSLDAGARNIEIRLKDYGAESIEVIDDGCGVEEDNFEGLTLKHATSKLKDFSDLVQVETFGFRGEALSSLCALSKLSIVTRYETAQNGTRLEFNNLGKITTRTPCARKVGTTVCVQDLFSTLPVRHKEFQRNLKKEFTKMVQVLNSYCLMCTDVKVLCTNQTAKGNKSTFLSTTGGSSVKENIVNIFGSKQMQSLMAFVQASPSEAVLEEYNIKPIDCDDQAFKLEGFVSSCEHGQGRGSTDRQIFYINKRPCDLTKVSRVVNDVYHMYNRHQYPMVVLNITMAAEDVDVNVTPDKRKIFLSQEKLLLATVKSSLIKLYESTPSTMKTNEIMFKSSMINARKQSCPAISPQKSVSSSLANLKRSFSSSFAEENASLSKSPEKKPKQRKLEGFILSSAEKSNNTMLDYVSQTSGALPSGHFKIHSKNEREEKLYESEPDSSKVPIAEDFEINPESNLSSHRVVIINHCEERSFENMHERSRSPHELESDSLQSKSLTAIHSNDSPPYSVRERNSHECSDMSNVTNLAQTTPEVFKDSYVNNEPTASLEIETTEKSVDVRLLNNPLSSFIDLKSKEPCVIEYDSEESKTSNKTVTVPFSIKSLKSRFSCRNSASNEQMNFRGFRAKITPGQNDQAEAELRKEISKEMFSKMKIVGQFNLGFIVVKYEDDLFIIDQHATDEKYNFEMLQRNTVIQNQKLIHAQHLELSAASETILLDNIEVFHKNGFDFTVDEEGPVTKRVKLVSMPVSKNWTFGKDDLEELIFMLSDSPGVMCRPSRVRQMFASRACRKSVMVGTALNKMEMRRLVDHMGQIEHPWNCPHGRPTMRHLVSINKLADIQSDSVMNSI